MLVDGGRRAILIAAGEHLWSLFRPLARRLSCFSPFSPVVPVTPGRTGGVVIKKRSHRAPRPQRRHHRPEAPAPGSGAFGFCLRHAPSPRAHAFSALPPAVHFLLHCCCAGAIRWYACSCITPRLVPRRQPHLAGPRTRCHPHHTRRCYRLPAIAIIDHPQDVLIMCI